MEQRRDIERGRYWKLCICCGGSVKESSSTKVIFGHQPEISAGVSLVCV